ncbi:MAG: helix-turn-helix transcriptional regulator [Acidimicrobiales bacterium]
MPPPRADERLARLLAMVPWVAERDGPPLAEVCARFGIAESELLADLEQLFLCGLYPYTPDVLIEVDVEEGRVWIRYADYFSRPLRLTPAEGLALVTAGRALTNVPGSDPQGSLARGLAKVAAALGVEGDGASGGAVEVELGQAPAETMSAIRDAAARRRRVAIEYYSFGRDEWRQREVDPWAVFSASGQWYLSAWCHAVGDERLFRLDRIASVRVLDEEFSPPETTGELSVFEPGPDAPRVTLELTASARWVVEQYPVEEVEELAGGGCRVILVAGERAWLERLLLRLGPDARVLNGDPEVAARAARRVLARYRR